MHGQSADQGLILGVVFPDIDLLALLGRAASVHDETPTSHRWHPPRLALLAAPETV
jgi:hypothetical protein